MASTTPSTGRAANRAAMEAGILRLGREHLSTHGAAGLSLRAIAREMGVVSSAVYRYVPSRDDLLTLLLVEGYRELADATRAAVEGIDESRSRERILAIATAMRDWAVTDPPRWALLYGSPVPGYRAPAEQTTEPGTRVIASLIDEYTRAERSGLLRTEDVVVPERLPGQFDGIRGEFSTQLSDAGLILAVTTWSTVIGAISLEVFGQYGADTFSDHPLLFATQVEQALARVSG